MIFLQAAVRKYRLPSLPKYWPPHGTQIAKIPKGHREDTPRLAQIRRQAFNMKVKALTTSGKSLRTFCRWAISRWSAAHLSIPAWRNQMNARKVGPLILAALMITGGCASLPMGRGTSGKGRTGSSYTVYGTTYHPLKSAKGFKQVGLASWYGRQHAGRRTASGERYNPYQMTAAHKILPMTTRVKVTNLENGKSVIVRINDRGPFVRGRVIDLSYAAARKIGMMEKGIVRVRVVALSGG